MKQRKRITKRNVAVESAKESADHVVSAVLTKSRIIKFSLCQSLRLFFINFAASWLCMAKCFTKDKLWRLHQEGERRLEKHLDIVKLIQRMRHLKIITGKLLESGQVKQHELYASRKNIINIDAFSSSQSSSIESTDDDQVTGGN